MLGIVGRLLHTIRYTSNCTGLTVPARLRRRASTTVDGYLTPVPARMHDEKGEHLLLKFRIEANVEDRKYGMLQCSQVDATGGVSGKPPRFTLSVHDMLFVIVLSTCCASTHSCALTTMSPSPGKSPIDAPTLPGLTLCTYIPSSSVSSFRPVSTGSPPRSLRFLTNVKVTIS